MVSLYLSYLSPFYNCDCKTYNCNYINLDKDGTTLILITVNINELCVISHSLKKTNKDILSIVPFPEQFKSKWKVKIIHVMLLMEMSTITWKLPVSSPKMSRKETFTRQCRTFSFRAVIWVQACEQRNCFNASSDTRYQYQGIGWNLQSSVTFPPEQCEKNSIYLKVLLPRSII